MAEARDNHASSDDSVHDYFSWQSNAECGRLVQIEPSLVDLWFSEEPGDEILAVSICSQCPVRLQCLKEACDARFEYGIWGGLTVSQRTRRGSSHRFIKLKAIPLELGNDNE